MRVVEYRIPLPLSLEEYHIAQLFTVAQTSLEQSCHATDGVRFLKNEPFKNEEMGQGYYTQKKITAAGKVPGWFLNFVSADWLTLEEESWNAYPRIKTVYKSEFLPKLRFSVASMHCEGVCSEENALNLNEEFLRQRRIVTLDIVNDEPASKEDSMTDRLQYNPEVRKRFGDFSSDWKDSQRSHKYPLITCYKLLVLDLPIGWGVSSRIENWIVSWMQNGLLAHHRKAICTIGKWHDLTLPQVRSLEGRVRERLDELYAEKTQKSSVSGNYGTSNRDGVSQIDVFLKDIKEAEESFTLSSEHVEQEATGEETAAAEAPNDRSPTLPLVRLSFETPVDTAYWVERSRAQSPTVPPCPPRTVEPPVATNATSLLDNSGANTSPSILTGKKARLMKGFLYKLGDGYLNTSWNLRYVVLKDHRLYYYRTQSDPIPRDVVDLEGASVIWNCEDIRNKPYSILVSPVGNTRRPNVYLSADSKEEAKRWLVALQLASVPPSSIAQSDVHIKTDDIRQDPLSGALEAQKTDGKQHSSPQSETASPARTATTLPKPTPEVQAQMTNQNNKATPDRLHCLAKEDAFVLHWVDGMERAARHIAAHAPESTCVKSCDAIALSSCHYPTPLGIRPQHLTLLDAEQVLGSDAAREEKVLLLTECLPRYYANKTFLQQFFPHSEPQGYTGQLKTALTLFFGVAVALLTTLRGQLRMLDSSFLSYVSRQDTVILFYPAVSLFLGVLSFGKAISCNNMFYCSTALVQSVLSMLRALVLAAVLYLLAGCILSVTLTGVAYLHEEAANLSPPPVSRKDCLSDNTYILLGYTAMSRKHSSPLWALCWILYPELRRQTPPTSSFHHQQELDMVQRTIHQQYVSRHQEHIVYINESPQGCISSASAETKGKATIANPVETPLVKTAEHDDEKERVHNEVILLNGPSVTSAQLQMAIQRQRSKRRTDVEGLPFTVAQSTPGDTKPPKVSHNVVFLWSSLARAISLECIARVLRYYHPEGKERRVLVKRRWGVTTSGAIFVVKYSIPPAEIAADRPPPAVLSSSAALSLKCASSVSDPGIPGTPTSVPDLQLAETLLRRCEAVVQRAKRLTSPPHEKVAVDSAAVLQFDTNSDRRLHEHHPCEGWLILPSIPSPSNLSETSPQNHTSPTPTNSLQLTNGSTYAVLHCVSAPSYSDSQNPAIPPELDFSGLWDTLRQHDLLDRISAINVLQNDTKRSRDIVSFFNDCDALDQSL